MIVLSIIGLIICIRRVSSAQRIYRYGCWFFALLGLSDFLLIITMLLPISNLVHNVHDLLFLSSALGFVRSSSRLVGFAVLTYGFYQQSIPQDSGDKKGLRYILANYKYWRK